MRKLLAVAEFQLGQPLKKLASQASMKSQTFAYTLRKLQDDRTISPRAFINFYRLGYMDFGVFFSLTTPSQDLRKKVLLHLCAEPGIAWCGVLAGDFQYSFSYVCINIGDLGLLFERLTAKFGDVLAEKLVSPRLSFSRFSRKYLHRDIKPACLSLTYPAPRFPADDLDLHILSHLGAHGGDSIRETARQLGEPFSTVERRLGRLERDGIIMGYHYEISSQALGVECYRVLLSCRGFSCELRDKVFSFCSKHPLVIFLTEALGPWEFEIGIEASRASEVMRLVHQAYEVCGPRLISVRVFTEIEELKSNLFPVLSPER